MGEGERGQGREREGDSVIESASLPASYVRVSENHNSLGYEQSPGLDVNQSLNAQDTFQPIPGLISCVGVTGSVGATCHVHATQMAGLRSPCMHSNDARDSRGPTAYTVSPRPSTCGREPRPEARREGRGGREGSRAA